MLLSYNEVRNNVPFPERPQLSPAQAWCSEGGDKLLYWGKTLCWSSHSYSPATKGRQKKNHFPPKILKMTPLYLMMPVFILTVFMKSSFLNRILSRCPNTHSGSALPSGQEGNVKNTHNTLESQVIQPGSVLFSFSYRDVDHRKGLDPLCGTLLSPSLQALRFWKLQHINTFSPSFSPNLLKHCPSN